MRRLPGPRLSIVLVVLLVCACARAASADSITSDSFFSGGLFGASPVVPFDERLGTLNSIQVAINGTLLVSGFAGPNFIPQPIPVPLPYSFEVDVNQEFRSPVAGKYFHFNSPALFRFVDIASGVGQQFLFTTQFSYDFTFNGISDLVGLVFPSTTSSSGGLIPPSAGITGPRADFVADLVPNNEIDLIQSASVIPLSAVLIPPTIASLSSVGSLQIRYNYTPTPAQVVPEPASIVLVGVGVIGFARRRRRQGQSPFL
jgi:hypothetical protein